MIMFMRGLPSVPVSMGPQKKEREKKRERKDSLHRKEIDHGLYDLFTDTKRALKGGSVRVCVCACAWGWRRK